MSRHAKIFSALLFVGFLMAALSHPCEVCANVDIDLEDGVRHCTKSEKLDGELWRAVDTLRGGGAVSGDAAKLRVVVELGDDPPLHRRLV